MQKKIGKEQSMMVLFLFSLMSSNGGVSIETNEIVICFVTIKLNIIEIAVFFLIRIVAVLYVFTLCVNGRQFLFLRILTLLIFFLSIQKKFIQENGLRTVICTVFTYFT